MMIAPQKLKPKNKKKKTKVSSELQEWSSNITTTVEIFIFYAYTASLFCELSAFPLAILMTSRNRYFQTIQDTMV